MNVNEINKLRVDLMVYVRRYADAHQNFVDATRRPDGDYKTFAKMREDAKLEIEKCVNEIINAAR